jgi:hypothetical protein
MMIMVKLCGQIFGGIRMLRISRTQANYSTLYSPQEAGNKKAREDLRIYDDPIYVSEANTCLRSPDASLRLYFCLFKLVYLIRQLSVSGQNLSNFR